MFAVIDFITMRGSPGCQLLDEGAVDLLLANG
jgi:hypothetical protein